MENTSLKLALSAAGALLLAATLSFAQPPTPAPPQSEPLALRGGTVHVGNGQVIENGAVAFAEGKITYVGDAAGLPTGYRTVDVSGQHVYPGLVLANISLGLEEIGAVRATRDKAEVGMLNPNVRALIAYNTDSDIIPTVRTNGILTVQITPRTGLISGTSSVVQLDAWNWEDAVVRADDAIHLNWPTRYVQGGWWAEPAPMKPNKKRDEHLQMLRTLFKDAKAYHAAPAETANLKLEALGQLFTGERQLFLHAEGAREMVEAVRFAQEFGVRRPVLAGASEAHLIVDFLKENEVPVVLSRLHRLPRLPESDVDQPYKTPQALADAGVLFTIDYEGDMENMGCRNLPFVAGTAAAYGLGKERALQAITLDAARILGVADRLGSLEEGKAATLVVSAGDLLDMRTNGVRQAFIDGRQLVLDNKQKALFEKFDGKYEAADK